MTLKGKTLVCVDNENYTSRLTVGNLYTVIAERSNLGGYRGGIIKIADDQGKLTSVYSDRFKAPDQQPGTRQPTWIIAVEQDGKLAPAAKPREFRTESQAKAVAAIMAKKAPGERFVIFSAVGEAFVEPQPQAVVTMY